MSISTDLSNGRPDAHDALISNTDVGPLSSPKSNAPLCEESDLIDGDAEGNQDPSIQVSSKQLVFPSDARTTNPDADEDELQQDPPLEPTGPLRVRFRPRVRITSGINRHRRKGPTTENHQDYFTFSPSSSSSGSPSSSISAPLRTRLDDEVGKPGWGTLGQRVALFARRQYPGQRIGQQPRGGGGLMAKGDVSERTPLLRPPLHFLLSRDSRLRCLYHEGNDDEDLSRCVDRVFGPWPDRLLNHHWWWWQIVPLITCQCFNECDDEG